MGSAFFAATLATAADFDDPGKVLRCCVVLVTGFVPALLCGGGACDDDAVLFGIMRLGNSTLVAVSVTTL